MSFTFRLQPLPSSEPSYSLLLVGQTAAKVCGRARRHPPPACSQHHRFDPDGKNARQAKSFQRLTQGATTAAAPSAAPSLGAQSSRERGGSFIGTRHSLKTEMFSMPTHLVLMRIDQR